MLFNHLSIPLHAEIFGKKEMAFLAGSFYICINYFLFLVINRKANSLIRIWLLIILSFSCFFLACIFPSSGFSSGKKKKSFFHCCYSCINLCCFRWIPPAVYSRKSKFFSGFPDRFSRDFSLQLYLFFVFNQKEKVINNKNK